MPPYTAPAASGCAQSARPPGGDRRHRDHRARAPHWPSGYAAAMAAPRAPAILLSLLVSASGLLRASAARADEEPQPQEGAETAAKPRRPPPPPSRSPTQRFGPRYVIDDVVVRGNHKTNKSIIVAEATALGLVQGAAVDASDPRVEAVRYRLLALGYFLDVRLSVTRGASPRRRRAGRRGRRARHHRHQRAVPEHQRGDDVLGRGGRVGDEPPRARDQPGRAGSSRRRRRRCRGPHAGWVCGCAPSVPPIGGPYGLSLSATALYNDGSEFYRVTGADDDSNPLNFVASRVKRAGGVLGVGKDFRSRVHAGLDFRQEALTAELPTGGRAGGRLHDPGRNQPARHRHRQRRSRYALRSDPAPVRHAHRAVAGGGERPARFELRVRQDRRARRRSSGRCRAGTRWGLHVFGGAIFGDAPYFDRFFVGDLNLLMPRRALGINFSTLSPPNLLGTSIAHHRYDNTPGACWSNTRSRSGGGAGSSTAAMPSSPPGCSASPASGTSGRRARPGSDSLPIDLTGDLGLRLDTYIGIFTISIANALSRAPVLMRAPMTRSRTALVVVAGARRHGGHARRRARARTSRCRSGRRARWSRTDSC